MTSGGLGSPYLAHLLPGEDSNDLWLAIAGDVMLLASVFVLGGEFWDKLRALFVHEARADWSSSQSAMQKDVV